MMVRRSRFLPIATVLLAAACGGSGSRDATPAAAGTATRPAAVQPADTSAAVPIPRSAPRAASVAGDSAHRRQVVVADVDLTDIGYDRGNPAAPVVLVEFSDFGCPFCGQFARETFPTIDREYVQTGKVFFKYVPFVMGMFPNSAEAARAAECAGDQGKFWPMYDRLYATQNDWKRTPVPFPAFQQDAAALGLDRGRFAQCYTSQDVHPRTRRATDAANRLGVRATPTFALNGRAIEGALPLAAFRTVLDAAVREHARGGSR